MTDTLKYDENTVHANWEDMGLPDEILRGIYSYGFERPSPIQQRAIHPIQCGRELIAQAQDL